MILKGLSSWIAPEGVVKPLQHADLEFDLVRGWEHSESIIEHVKTDATPGTLEIYKLALADQAACGVIRAKRPGDGGLLGTVVLYNASCTWAEAVPPLKDNGAVRGGISSPVIISSSPEAHSTLLQGLVLLGIRQLKSQQVEAVLLDYVSFIRHILDASQFADR